MPDKGNPCLILDSLARAYHWSHADMMKLTMPQLIMYNHAAWVNNTNSERRYKSTGGAEEDENPVVANGKRVDELGTDELAAYLDF